MEHFYFKGIDSRTMGIVERMPSFVRSQMDYHSTNIEYLDGTILEEQSLRGYTDSFDFTIRDISKTDEVMAWLFGKGIFIVSDDSDKYRHVAMLNEMIYLRKTSIAKTVRIPIIVYDPFRYALNEDSIELTDAATITNQGTYFSRPIISIDGTGVVELDINGRTFVYDFGFDSYVIIDSAKQEAYVIDENEVILKNRQMSGEFHQYNTNFPIFDVGENDISWIGNITKITITANTRWL